MLRSKASVNVEGTLERRIAPDATSPLLNPEGLKVPSNTDEGLVDVQPLEFRAARLDSVGDAADVCA